METADVHAAFAARLVYGGQKEWLANRYDKLTFGSEIWDNPCIVEESKNSFKLSILEPDWPMDNQTYVIEALQ